MLRLLHRRFQARSGVLAPTKQLAFYCRIALDFGGERILLEEESWNAARMVLEYDGAARLHFIFAVKEKGGGEERGKWWEKWKRKGGEGVCLIEPVL